MPGTRRLGFRWRAVLVEFSARQSTASSTDVRGTGVQCVLSFTYSFAG
eukprot:SAG31_NODE_1352_length_8668_cov_38.573229_9_plen_48_part_00